MPEKANSHKSTIKCIRRGYNFAFARYRVMAPS